MLLSKVFPKYFCVYFLYDSFHSRARVFTYPGACKRLCELHPMSLDSRDLKSLASEKKSAVRHDALVIEDR